MGDDKAEDEDEDEPECVNAGGEERDAPVDDAIDSEVIERWGRYRRRPLNCTSAGSVAGSAAAVDNGLRV